MKQIARSLGVKAIVVRLSYSQVATIRIVVLYNIDCVKCVAAMPWLLTFMYYGRHQKWGRDDPELRTDSSVFEL